MLWLSPLKKLSQQTITYSKVTIKILSSAFLIQKFLHRQKNCQRKSKITELFSEVVWNMLAIKIPNINLGYDSKMGGNCNLILKLVSRSVHIPKCNLRTILFPVAYFELWEKQVSFFPDNMRLPILIGSSMNEEHSNPIV